ILEKYLTARHTHHFMNEKEPLREEVMDLGASFSPTLVNVFGYFDVPLCYFDKVHLSWPWRGEDCWPVTLAVCKDFVGLIVSAEMMVHHELNPFYGGKYYDSCKSYLKNVMTTPPCSFSSQWLKYGRRD
ncbi:TPA: hypothetical protein ACP61A_004850, partial [Escherichia coli]